MTVTYEVKKLDIGNVRETLIKVQYGSGDLIAYVPPNLRVVWDVDIQMIQTSGLVSFSGAIPNINPVLVYPTTFPMNPGDASGVLTICVASNASGTAFIVRTVGQV